MNWPKKVHDVLVKNIWIFHKKVVRVLIEIVNLKDGLNYLNSKHLYLLDMAKIQNNGKAGTLIHCW